ncbi:N-alpha-acetyltransferase 40 [Rhizophlyctis rosea]|uniref:N-alpha-acetyltransferase 40 n=1 Tax=Rhizophlyctis rosea TaxID=64517 RepID=A0AAD5X722_9FUNG|nr:N-alpha-acetyltransferase 40 [Rhizophlyctis rosea]
MDASVKASSSSSHSLPELPANRVSAACNHPDPFSGVALPLQYENRGLTLKIRYHTLETLPPEHFDWAFHLVKSNLYEQYVAAKDTGWSDDDKRAEMQAENPRYLIAFDETAPTTTPPRPVAFCYFQFTLEDDCEVPNAETTSDTSKADKSADKKRGSEEVVAFEKSQTSVKKPRIDSDTLQHDPKVAKPTREAIAPDDDDEDYEDVEDEKIPVVYCYELQLESDARGKGLGAYLMNLIEEVGTAWGMRKVMLTAFKSNVSAMAFYKRLGWV